jgi:hypothetical protein
MIKYKYFISAIVYSGQPRDSVPGFRIGNIVYVTKKPVKTIQQIRKIEKLIGYKYSGYACAVINYRLLRKISIDSNVNKEYVNETEPNLCDNCRNEIT